jgi:predicted dithiol-disulfide oxidoreductase (DUF899 family)
MTDHRIGTQEEWQVERDGLLKEERELTRRGDEPARKRRELPWVPVEKDSGSRPRTARGCSPISRDESASEPLWVRRHDEYETS